MKTDQTAGNAFLFLLAVVAIVGGDFLIHRYVAFGGTQTGAESAENAGSYSHENRGLFHDTQTFVPVVEKLVDAPRFRPDNQWTPPEERGGSIRSQVAAHNARYGSSSATRHQFQSDLAGLRLAQEVVLNNIANAGSTAFKRSRTKFTDLAYKQVRLPGASDAQGQLSPIGLAVGLGSRILGTEVDHSAGSLLQTGKQLDIAIVGDGFFQIQNGSEIRYTRSGTFTTNANGEIVLASSDRGRLLEPAITIPADSIDIVITSDGTVSVRQAGSETLTHIGQIQLARFVNRQGLIQLGDGLYGLTDASGQPQIGSPGTDGRGELRSGFLESSNVEPESELFELRRLESHRRVIRLAMELLMPEDQRVDSASR